MLRRILASLVLLAPPAIAVWSGIRMLLLPAPPPPPPPRVRIHVDPERVANHLAALVRLETVSAADAGPVTAAVWAALPQRLLELWPEVHAIAGRYRIGRGILYAWPGTMPLARPILLVAHLDVVPAPASGWRHPPFAGTITDGYVWGRGTLDDKAAVTAIFEAIAALHAAEWFPARTVMVALGFDEEVGGRMGARRIAAWLARRPLPPLAVLDEGLAITEGLLPGVTRPVALVGLAEKGYMTVELAATAPGGHSSLPGRELAVARLVQALERLLETPQPRVLDGLVARMLTDLAPVASGPTRWALANLWLTRPLLEHRLAATPSGAALLGTTLAPTLLRAGTKENVLPTTATAVLNLRVHPRETTAVVWRRLRARLRGLPGVQLRLRSEMLAEPSPPSPSDDRYYDELVAAIRATYPDAAVAPGLVVGATDARHYAGITPRIYRFAPLRLGPTDLARIHGVDERIAVDDLVAMARFYAELIVRWAGSESVAASP